jgi:hypothetical protein
MGANLDALRDMIGKAALGLDRVPTPFPPPPESAHHTSRHDATLPPHTTSEAATATPLHNT